MTEQQSKAKQVYTPYRSKKFFISSLNTHLGHILVDRLRNDSTHPENPNQIVGTLAKQNLQQKYNFVPQSGIRKVIETDKVQFFHDVLLNSDVIIYDLNTADPHQVESAIAALKIQKYQEEKMLICVSNVMTWARTKPKQKKEGDEEQGDQNPPEEPESQEEGAEQPPEEQEKKVYTRFNDKDYNLRRPHPDYQRIKSLETLCLAAGTSKLNFKTYVLCSGILYGRGQNLLYPYFMQARLQKPEALVVYGKGKNRIPMIHIADLATYIQKTIQKKPSIPYLLALDHNSKPTQKLIIESISKGIGTGKITYQNNDTGVQNINLLTLDLRMRPTMFFEKLAEEQAAIEVDEGVEIERFKFEWQSKEGVHKNIQKLNKQFNQEYGLKQEKIFIQGPPGCGKSYHAQKLAQKYYLPHLTIKKVLDEVMSLPTEFGQQIRNAFNDKKQSEIATKQQEYQAKKQKWKKMPKEFRQLLEPFYPESVDVRLPDELIFKCFKWRLEMNDCLNRGYVLDGFPKLYEQAKQIFMGYPPLPEGQEPDQNTQKVVDERLVPTKYILLEQSDEQILKRLQQLPQEQIADTHFSESRAKQRLKRYRKIMDPSTGDYILNDFFEQNKIQTHKIKVSNNTQTLLESIISPLSISQKEQHKKILQTIQRQKQRKQKARSQMNRKQEIIRNIQTQDYRMKKENEQNQEREILDKKSLALRKYLDVNLVPILSEGILEILTEFPSDPVDKLAQFLFKNSLKVPNPDPSTFEF